MADMLTALANQVATKASLTLGTDLFTSYPVPPDDDVPVECTFMWESDGWTKPRPEMKSYDAGDKKVWCQSFVYVKVRKEARQYTEGRQLFDAIYAALECARLTASDVTLKWVRAMKPKPLFIGPEEQNFLTWELKFECGYFVLVQSN
jgi:hypothetical protein